MLVKNVKNSKKVTSLDGSEVYELLNPLNDPIPDTLSVALAIVKKGEATLPHRLEFTEVYYILKGRGLVAIEGETREVEEGDAVYIPARAVQNIENTGDRDLVFLCVCQPGYYTEGDGVVENLL